MFAPSSHRLWQDGGDDEGNDDDPGAPDGDGMRLGADLTTTQKLRLEWLDACAEEKKWYTWMSRAGVHCAQLLMKKKRLVTVRCFDHEVELGGRWLLKSFELWRGDELRAGTTAEIYVYPADECNPAAQICYPLGHF